MTAAKMLFCLLLYVIKKQIIIAELQTIAASYLMYLHQEITQIHADIVQNNILPRAISNYISYILVTIFQGEQ